MVQVQVIVGDEYVAYVGMPWLWLEQLVYEYFLPGLRMHLYSYQKGQIHTNGWINVV